MILRDIFKVGKNGKLEPRTTPRVKKDPILGRIYLKASRRIVAGKLTVEDAGAWLERLKRRVGYGV